MNDKQLKAKTLNAFNRLIDSKGFVAPIDVFIELGILSSNDYENWRCGRVRYLEQVVKMNLRKINLSIKEIKLIADDKNLKPSKTVYNQWGKKGIGLQFSKNGTKYLDDLYSTHYIRSKNEQAK
jgi:uncharacterized protein YfkK (UPF0435 family)